MMLDIDGALIIYEGLRRLRWSHQPGATTRSTSGLSTAPVHRIVDRVWPDLATEKRIRRQIEHGQKVVVVIDDADPVVVLPWQSVPAVPAGSVIDEGPDHCSVALSVPPFTWLSWAGRARGEAFSAHAQSVLARIPAPTRPRVLVEAALVGTAEPLRFVHQARPMTIDLIREVVRLLYTTRAPTKMHTTTTEQHPAPATWLLRSHAA